MARLRPITIVFLLLTTHCSDGNGTAPETAQPATDTAASNDGQSDVSDTQSSDTLSLDTEAPTDTAEATDSTTTTDSTDVADGEEPPPSTGWTALSLGATGRLHKVRFLGEHGFRLVGEDGCILRELGTGWIRAWTPYDTPTIRDVTALGSALHSVGDAGTWLRRDSVGAWQPWPSAVTSDFRGLTVLEGALYAVGTNGTAVRRDGETFSYELNVPDYDLLGLASIGADLYAPATGGLVLRRIWKATDCVEGDEDLCIACQDDSDCSAGMCRTMAGESSPRCTRPCGNEGAAACPAEMECFEATEEAYCRPTPDFQWFHTAVAAPDINLRAAYALDPLNVWVVGDQQNIAHFNGQWTLESAPEEDSTALYAVAGGGGRLLSTGNKGTFLQRTAAGEWAPVHDVEGPLLVHYDYAGIAIGGDRIVAAGADGAMQIKQLPEGPFLDGYARPNATIRDIARSGDTTVAVGDDGLLVWMDALGFGALESGTQETLHAAHFDEEGRLWVVGTGGTVLHRNDDGIVLIDSGTAATLYGLTTLPNGLILAVGQAGIALRFDPDTLTVAMEDTQQSWDLFDVFLDGGIPTSVGAHGTLLQRIGGSWEPIPSGTAADLHAGASNGTQALVVGTSGTILRWGSGGAAVASTVLDPTVIYYDVSVSDDGSAHLVGWAGALHHVDPSGLVSELESPTADALYTVNPTETGWLIGGGQAALWTYTPEED